VIIKNKDTFLEFLDDLGEGNEDESFNEDLALVIKKIKEMKPTKKDEIR